MAAPDTPPRKELVVFDFDGTLTTEDTFVLFMKRYCGTLSWYLKMLPLTSVFLRYKLGRIDRHAVKHAVVRAVFTGEPMARIASEAEAFARRDIPKLIRPAGLSRFTERVEAMGTGGPDVVICSASISPYLRSYIGLLSEDNTAFTKVKIVACELEADAQKNATGRLRGRNVWGENKLKALREEFRSYSIHLVESYGDSAGDVAILDAADTAYWRPFRVR